MVEETFELRQQIRIGDPEALAWVYTHYCGSVQMLVGSGFTMRHARPVHVPGVRDNAAQEDLVQEVFLKAFAAPARRAYDAERPYRPYLLSIARSVHIDHARRQRVRGALEGPETSASLSLPRGDLEDTIDRAHQVMALVSLLAGSDAETRRYHALRFEEECSQDDVARQMGVSRRHVRTLESRLFVAARRCLLGTACGVHVPTGSPCRERAP